MDNERRLPPTDLHNLGYNIPYFLRFDCYKCGCSNEVKESFSDAELTAIATNKNRLMTVVCKKCKESLQFNGYDLITGSGYII